MASQAAHTPGRALIEQFCPDPARLRGHDALALPDTLQLLANVSDLARRRPPGTTMRASLLAGRIAQLAEQSPSNCLHARLATQLRWCGAAIDAPATTATPVQCDVSATTAQLLGLPAPAEQALASWPGAPAPLAQPLQHIVQLADDLITLQHSPAALEAKAWLLGRAGHAYPASLAHEALRLAPEWCQAPLTSTPASVSADFLPASASLTLVADVAERALPCWSAHARRVAALALGAAERLGLPEREHGVLVRAALLHGLGRLALPRRLWTQRTQLLEQDWVLVRRAPYMTARALGSVLALAEAGALAAQVYERLDGSGYGMRLQQDALGTAQRILASATMLVALRAPRPWRRALGQAAAETVLAAQVSAGKLDRQAVAALLDAARERVPEAAQSLLSLREREVLQRLGQGASTQVVARALRLSHKSVLEHEQACLAKLGSPTRAGALLKALALGMA